MGKTRRKLYRRRRRQRGGGRLWWALFGALAALDGAKAENPTLRDLASKWWNDGGWGNSKALADGLTKALPSFTLPDGLFDVKTDALWSAPPAVTELSEEQKEVVAPYLTEVDLKGLREGDGTRYKYEGREFSVETWNNLGEGGVKISTGEGEEIIVKKPMEARFQVVSVPPQPDEEEEVFPEEDEERGGRRRNRKRKTLRRKK